jgi:hypothetical protein
VLVERGAVDLVEALVDDLRQVLHLLLRGGEQAAELLLIGLALLVARLEVEQLPRARRRRRAARTGAAVETQADEALWDRDRVRGGHAQLTPSARLRCPP